MSSTGKRLTGADVLVRNDDGLLTTHVAGDDRDGVEQGTCCGLNAVGTRNWGLVADRRSLDNL